MFRFIISFLLLSSIAFADHYDFGSATIEDCYLYPDGADLNYGATTVLLITGAEYRSLMRINDVADSLPASITVDACTLYIYVPEVINVTATISAFRGFKTGWVEGSGDGTDVAGATYNDWSADDLEWGTAGCNNTDDGGSDNTGDGTGADRKATAEGSDTQTSAPVWFTIPITAAYVQAVYDASGSINLELHRTADGGDDYPRWHSSENASNKPYLRVYYTVTGGGGGLLYPILK